MLEGCHYQRNYLLIHTHVLIGICVRRDWFTIYSACLVTLIENDRAIDRYITYLIKYLLGAEFRLHRYVYFSHVFKLC